MTLEELIISTFSASAMFLLPLLVHCNSLILEIDGSIVLKFLFGLRLFVCFLFIVTLFLLKPLDARADADNMLQTWPTVVLEFEGDHVVGFGEVQTRTGFASKPGEGMQYLFLRGGMGYRVTKHLSLLQGYAYNPGFQPQFFVENRLFQQLDYKRHLKKLKVSFRSRLEERFIEHVDGVAIRNRNKLKLSYPIGHVEPGEHARLSAVVYDEHFYFLNSTHSPEFQRGFDQNRAFAGFDYRWNERFTTEFGYLMQYNNRHNEHDLVNHVIALQTVIKVGKIKKKDKNPDEYDDEDYNEGGN